MFSDGKIRSLMKNYASCLRSSVAWKNARLLSTLYLVIQGEDWKAASLHEQDELMECLRRGFAFVTFEDVRDAADAVQELNGFVCYNRVEGLSQSSCV